jgi:inward rectifier potassium channel
MSAPALPPHGSRPYRQPQGFTFWVLGGQRALLRDAYHSFLRLRWSASIALISVGLALANLAFAGVYYAIGGIAGAKGTFFDMFSFSVQTMATIGYGVMSPASQAAQAVMIVEALFGIVIVALATGLVFTKFARATARMAFSRYAVIAQHEGKPTLMFRCGNQRSNVIVQAQLYVTAAFITTTAEGRPFYKLHDLELVRDRMSGLRRGWIVMHVIDEASPFHGKDAAALKAADCELEISLTGLDDVTMQTVHTIHSYGFEDIKLGHRLVDTMHALANGDLVLDLTKFDVIEPDVRASVAA